MASNTALDLLIAEMLGDISKLHDAVDSLKEVLPRETKSVEESMTRLISLLQKAGDTYKGLVETYTEDQLEAVRDQINGAMVTVRGQMVGDANAAKVSLDGAIGRALADIKITVKSAVDSAMTKPVHQVIQSMEKSTWRNIGFCLLSGLVGGSVPMVFWSIFH